jgi:hypothetical protein
VKHRSRSSFGKLIQFLERLERDHIWYRLEHVRESIMVIVTVPGQRWEVEFFEDGDVEVERFCSSGKIEGEETLEQLLADQAS